ncbi:MAG: hypothetical protein VCE43_24135 [Myxococcota bacterium]
MALSLSTMSTGEPNTPESSDARGAFSAFAFLWAAAALFEYAGAIQRVGPLALTLIVVFGRLAAVWVLARPASAFRLLVLCGALIAIIVAKLPKGPNHGILVLVASATVILAAARVMAASRNWRIPAAELYAAFAPALRWELLALYFWAVFQKLNSDFILVDLSCGPAQVWNLHRVLDFLPESQMLRTFGVHGTLLVEAGIPCLLLFRTTRYFGVALAIGFHFTLGANYTGFSAMLFAMLSLFLPGRFYASLSTIFGRVSSGITTAGQRALRVLDTALGFTVIGVGTVAVIVAVFFSKASSVLAGPAWIDAQLLLALWFLYGTAVTVLFALGAWAARPWNTGERAQLRFRYVSLAIMPLLVFANGLAPHLGLKNAQVFAMFSNLHTHGGQSNHLFIPGSWQRWDHLGDLVTIHESNDPVLAKMVGRSWKTFNYFSTYVVDRPRMERTQPAPQWRLPYLALRRRITDLADSGRTNVELVYERAGVIRRLEHAETDPELSSLPWLARKFLLLRAIPDTSRGYCMW